MRWGGVVSSPGTLVGWGDHSSGGCLELQTYCGTTFRDLTSLIFLTLYRGVKGTDRHWHDGLYINF